MAPFRGAASGPRAGYAAKLGSLDTFSKRTGEAMKKTLLRVSFAAGLLAATVFGWPMDGPYKCRFEATKEACHACCVETKQAMMEWAQTFEGREKNALLKEATRMFVDCVESCKPECDQDCDSGCE
jgi:hypothetical protein